jgi:hypothetical protein
MAEKSPRGKKKRLKGDAFVKSPGQTETPEEQSQETAELTEEQEVSQTGSERIIFVRYTKSDGQISAIQEILLDRDKMSGLPWTNIPEDMEVKEFVLTDDLLDKDIINIHQDYKVSTTRGKPKLIPKK